MPKIRFLKNNLIIDSEVGANLMRTLLEAQIPVASSCDGEGICRKCKITVKDQINAQDLTEYEKLAFEMSEIKINQRLACQVTIRQELTIDASYW